MAHPIRSRHRRLDVLCRRLHPHLSWALLRLVQGAPRATLVARRHHLALDDGHRVLRLHVALGSNELLGRHRDYESVLRNPGGRRQHCDVALWRGRGRRSDTPPPLFSSLPTAPPLPFPPPPS